jgi:SAM-dependent methyltransferase
LRCRAGGKAGSVGRLLGLRRQTDKEIEVAQKYSPFMGAKPRYDGVAEWYDDTFAQYARGDTSSAAHLQRLLGDGHGWCLDIACGTGIHFEAIAATGRRVLGLDISTDQLRRAQRRTTALVLADAIRLPFEDRSFDTVTSTYLHTDIDDIGQVFSEGERVLRPGGRFVYIGVHPCFIGHFVELQDERTKIIHPGYRDEGRHDDSPYFRHEGLGQRVGYQHVPLANLIGALIACGLRLTVIEEPPEDQPPASDIPGMLALVAVKE